MPPTPGSSYGQFQDHRSPGDPQLQCNGLTVTFKDADGGLPFRALDDVNLTSAPGQLHVVTGPSGSGKSTLLYAMSGLMRADAGEVRFGDVSLSTMSETDRDAWRRSHVGFVFQTFHLIQELNARDNVLLPVWFGQWRAGDFADRARQLLDDLNVPLGRGPARHLSRGEQQRVALARALIFDPPIILADEPTASLDLATGETVISMLGDLARKEGRTVIVVSHDPVLIAAADTITTLQRGTAAPATGSRFTATAPNATDWAMTAGSGVPLSKGTTPGSGGDVI